MSGAIKKFWFIRIVVSAVVCGFVVGGFLSPPAAAQQKGGIPSAAKLTRQGYTYVVTIPGVPWTLQFPADDLEPILSQVQSGHSYFGLTHRSLARLWRMSQQGEKPTGGNSRA